MKTYKITEEQLREIITTTLIVGNNFAIENPTTDEGIDELINKVFKDNLKNFEQWLQD